MAIWQKPFSRCRVDPITEMMHGDRPVAPAQRSKPRKRPPMDKPTFPRVDELKKKLKAAMAKPVSIEKVMELSGFALAFHKAGAVADSYNAFAYAVSAARFLPECQQEDALRHVRTEFRKTDMDIACYEGLLCSYGAFRQIQAR